jgi:hypothetical protein
MVRPGAGHPIAGLSEKSLRVVAAEKYLPSCIPTYIVLKAPDDSAHPANWTISNPLKANNFTLRHSSFQKWKRPFVFFFWAPHFLASVDIVDNVTRIFPTFLLFWCCGLRHWACLSDDKALTFESRANALGALDFNMIMRPRLRTVGL